MCKKFTNCVAAFIIYNVITKNIKMHSVANWTLTHKLYMWYSSSHIELLMALITWRQRSSTANVRINILFTITSDRFYYPCTKCCTVIHRCSLNTALHIRQQAKFLGCDIRWTWGPGVWSTTTMPSARKCFVKKCQRPVIPVWERAIMLNNEWV
jgi:hypothetical protein